MRKLVFSLMTIVGATVLIAFSGLLWAQAPPISVTVTFDKDYFDSGEPMGVTVTVANTIQGNTFWSIRGLSPSSSTSKCG